MQMRSIYKNRIPSALLPVLDACMNSIASNTVMQLRMRVRARV